MRLSIRYDTAHIQQEKNNELLIIIFSYVKSNRNLVIEMIEYTTGNVILKMKHMCAL